jgi:hypothetical protein
VRTTATVISCWYQVNLFSCPRQRIPMPKSSRPTRIGEFISSSCHQVRQHDPMPKWSRPKRIGEFISSGHCQVGQRIPMPKVGDWQESWRLHKKLQVGFSGPFSHWDPNLELPKQICGARQSQTDYSPKSVQEEVDAIICWSRTWKNSKWQSTLLPKPRSSLH